MAPALIICTPEIPCEPSLAVAAARAGALGLLDLSWAPPAVAARATARLQAALAASPAAASPWGCRWDAWGRRDRLAGIPVPSGGRWPWLLIAGCAHEPALLRAALEQARSVADRVLVETLDPASAGAAEAAGCDGVVLKGQEAGGSVGEWSTFLLAQAASRDLRGPWWAWGALGPEAAAALIVAGATGVVLRDELFLVDESPFSEADRRRLLPLDGTETVVLGDARGRIRLLRHGARKAVAALEQAIAAGEDWQASLAARLTEAAASERPDALSECPLPLGQGIALAARMQALGGGRLARVVAAYAGARSQCAGQAQARAALGPDSPLAMSHGTRHPIVQGPMTRVSDVAGFARCVADAGALPFLALALLRGPEVEALLHETAAALGDAPWGVGILGFVPPELRQEQVAALRAAPPRFALIAGGRPSQAAELEALGIATYLHAPSPALLAAFLAQGARRFVLEGRECGGHVGPRSSLLLWQAAIDVLRDADLPDPESVHVLFAGGVHDAVSAAVVATLAAPLTERGMRIGVLMGTAYLFTPEAVSSRAIGEAFQEAALACGETVLLESAPGHATRCARTPFAAEFERKKRELVAAGAPPEQLRLELEMLNVGRLRIASKGLRRRPPAGSTPTGSTQTGSTPTGSTPSAARGALARGEELLRGELVAVTRDQQQRDGLFMIGQLAALRDRIVPMAELHDDVSTGSVLRLARALARARPAPPARRPAQEPLAIVGMACLFPGSSDVRQFWRRLVAGTDEIRGVPESRWRAELFHSADRADRDATPCTRGSFLEPLRFDPLRYRIPPASLASIEPLQLLALEVAARALADAGADGASFPRDRTAVIFGTSAIHDLGIALATRVMLRHFLDRIGALDGAGREIEARIRAYLPVWTEDSFPGILPNMVAGRVANRLDLRGANYTVDAACASSLAALHAAAQQLRAGTCDVALVGGADASNNAVGFMGFARTHALTSAPHPRPFDERADGIALGEGVGALVLKRLADAERDGDRVRAVVRGIGCSSDGGRKSLTAPSAEGQVLAIRRALEDAGVEASALSLVEAHATGTAVGDRTELLALQQVLSEAGAAPRSCAVGSAKSQVGHAKTAAGLVGLVKTVLALEHRLLPPTIHADEPLPEAMREDGPVYLCTRPRPWVSAGVPRRAGVSAFGFGGTNFHAVLEEHDDGNGGRRRADLSARPVEILAWRRASRADLARDLRSLIDALSAAPLPPLEQVAASVHADERARSATGSGVRLAVIASSVPELVGRLGEAASILEGGSGALDPQHAWLGEGEPADPATVCFLFPGQGSQSPEMLRDLLACPAGIRLLDEADALLSTELEQPLSRSMFPLPSADPAAAKRDAAALADTRVAQPALGVADLRAHDELVRFGLRPAFAGGHSYGEYVALTIAGTVSRADLLLLSARRGKAVHEVARDNAGAMAAVAADEDTVRAALSHFGIGAEIANLNAPRQTIIGGPVDAIASALRSFPGRGLAIRQIAVTAAFHTRAMRDVGRRLAGLLEAVPMRPPALKVYSNVTARAYPDDLAGIRGLLAEHLAHPVRFVEQIRAMHRDGARVFIEAGPGRVLTGLVKRILGDAPHVALPVDDGSESAWASLARLLGRTHAMGLPVDVSPWSEGRGLDPVPLAAALARAREALGGGPLDWWVAPEGSRPVAAPPGAPAASSVPTPKHAQQILFTQPASEPAAPAGASAPARPGDISQMTDNDKPLPAERAPLPADAAAGFQDTMRQWLAQRAELDQRFLALQERYLETLGGAATPRATSAAPGAPLPPPVSAPASRRSRVAPAPILPRLAPAPAPTPTDAGAPAPDAPKATTAPKAAAAATPPADPAAPPPVEDFLRDLLAEVSQRTGYPEDVLDLDTPMESGLGIDSIKVMEIFGSLRRYHPVFAAGNSAEEDAIAEFAQLRTLRAILEAYQRRRAAMLAGPPTGEAAPSEAGMRETTAPAPATDRTAAASAARPLPAPATATRPAARFESPSEHVGRRAVRAVPAPFDAGDEPLHGGIPLVSPDRVLVILGRGDGIGHALEPALAAAGLRVVRVVPGPALRRLDAQRIEADLTTSAGARALAHELREQGLRAGGLLNLLALDADAGRGDATDAGLHASLALLHAWQGFEEEMLSASAAGGALVAGLTRLDGRFGMTGCRPPSVAAAASLGFLKAVAREIPGSRLKLIDLAPGASEETLLAAVVRELTCGDAETEVGFDDAGRWRLEVASEEAEEPEAEPLRLDEDSIVLVTGGARGITTSVLELVARRSRPTLVIAGRTEPGSDADEPPEIRGLADAASVRRALVESMRARGRDVVPAEIDARARGILASREVRQSLERLREAGARVDYRVLDVRDASAFAALVEELQRTGRLHGVIHAAGVIEDRRLRDKSDDSFARVFETKVRPALVLARSLDPGQVRFVAFFSSMSARVGNAGQVDYAAANEVLNKIADHAARAWPCRVVAVNWGPWDGGMMSETLRDAYRRRGVGLIPPEAGARAFLDVLQGAARDAAEVVVACGRPEMARVAGESVRS